MQVYTYAVKFTGGLNRFESNLSFNIVYAIITLMIYIVI